jgi:hypothetical protein
MMPVPMNTAGRISSSFQSSSIHKSKERIMNRRSKPSSLVLSVILAMLLMLALPQVPVRAASQIFITPSGSGSCSQASPCNLATGLALAVTGDAIFAGAGVYTASSGNEVALLDEPIYLYGGWNGAASGPITRDPQVYVSILDGQNLRRGLTINYTPSAGIRPVVQGWTIRYGNATGLTDTCQVWAFTGAGCGGGIYINGSDPMIVGNIIHSNNAATVDTGLGGGGGIYLVNSAATLIFDNEIHDNNSNPAGEGWGGGIYIKESGGDIIVDQNDIHHNDNSAIEEPHYGSGLALHDNTGALLVKNNRIHDNAQEGPYHIGNALFCQYCNNQVTIQGNQMLDNLGDSALALSYSSPLVQQNTIINPGSTMGLLFGSGTTGQAINIFNNIIARHSWVNIHSQQTSSTNTSATLIHNSLADAPVGLMVGSSPGLGSYTIVFSKGIVSGHTDIGITNTAPAILSVADTLFHDNFADGVIGTNPLYGDPAFKSPVTYNYHLGRSSQAIDRLASGLSLDIDGDARPFGSSVTPIDAGADEFIHSVFFFLPLIGK